MFEALSTAARGWRTVLVATLLAIVAMVIYLNIAAYKFTAIVKLTTTQAAGGLGSQLGNLGALASIASVRLPQGSGEQNFLNFSQSLISRSTAEGLLSRPDLLHVMFEREWDPASRRWIEPHGTVKNIATFGRTLLGLPVFRYRPPDAARIQEYLEKNVNVVEDTRKPIIVMSYSHENPKFAASLLATVTTIDDETLRARSLVRAKDYISYLENQLRVVQLAETRTALAAVLGEQEKVRMLASASAPFAAEPVSAVGVSDQPTTPRPVAFLIASAVGGLIAGVITTLVQAGLKVSRSQLPE